jgi:hypothetical protein
MYRKLPVIAVTCWLIAANAGAAQDIDWDMGKQPSISVPLEPGEYHLIIRGAVFGASYKRSVSVDTIPIPGLPPISSVPVPGFSQTEPEADGKAGDKPNPQPDKAPDPCAPYHAQLANLVKVASTAFLKPDLAKRGAEEAFSFAMTELEAAMDSPPSFAGPPPVQCSAQAARKKYEALREASKFEIKLLTVKRGQILKAQISRALGEDAEGMKFAFEGSTGKRGSWQASYGFGMTPNKDRHYYSKDADDDTFVITQKHDNGGVQPNAAIFYTWQPAKWENSYFSTGVAGGIGVDQNSLVLLFGPHFTFNQNFGIVAGIALHQESRLRGEYEVGQTVSENLTTEALEEKINQTTWFIGVTYHFAEAAK